ncbi:MAG: uroporphyrinogen-III synthase [Ignisphaera sp.]
MKCRIAVFSPDTKIPNKLLDIGSILWLPFIELEPINGSSIEAIMYLKRCPIAVVVSPRTIEILVRDAENNKLMNVLIEAIKRSTVVVIGRGTAESIRNYLQIEPHIVSPKPFTEELMKYLESMGIKCVTLFKAEGGVIDVDRYPSMSIYVVKVYRYRVVEENLELVKKLIERRGIDVLAVTSYTIAKILCRKVESLNNLPLAVLGRTTAKAVTEFCRDVDSVLVGDGTIEMFREIIMNICSEARRVFW